MLASSDRHLLRQKLIKAQETEGKKESGQNGVGPWG